MKKLTLFIIIISVFGIISTEFFFLTPSYLWFTREITDVFKLDVLGMHGLSRHTREINFLCYTLFLFGGLFYHFSEGKETRVIRFLFAVILISRIAAILTAVILLFTRMENPEAVLQFPYFLFDISIDAIWFYISFRILNYLNSERVLEVNTIVYNGVSTAFFVTTSTTQRFFHLIVDAIVTILVFSSTLYALIGLAPFRNLIGMITPVIGDRVSVILIISFFRLIYYVFFEVYFQSSPAKFLTGNRVTTEDGSPISLKKSLKRSFSRFVPFDSLSFVFGNTGWHDKWSDTTVLKEQKTGIKGAYYFLIILILVLVTYAGTYVSFLIGR